MRRLVILALLAALTAVGGSLVAPASAQTDLRFAPPGANNWSCKPTAVHPRPVVLIHGLGATAGANWFHLSPILAAQGYCVFALTYGVDPRAAAFGAPGPGGTIPVEQSATELAAFVDRVLAATGAAQVDFVGHSEGTFMPQYYLKFLGGAAKVKRYVNYTPLYAGTRLGGLPELIAALQGSGLSAAGISLVSAFCGSCPQFLNGSPMQQKLVAGGIAAPGVEYTTVMTKYDELVVPYTSGYLPGAHNVVLQDICPFDFSEHAGPAFDPNADQITLNALDPEHAKPFVCKPFLG